MFENPFISFREENNLTYIQAAKRLGVSLTYYQRLNDGMIPTLTNELLQKLYEEGGERPAVAEYNYLHWVVEELDKVSFPVGIELNKNTSREEWAAYRVLLCERNGLEISSLATARLLKINPAILSKWEAGKMKSIPESILNRVRDGSK